MKVSYTARKNLLELCLHVTIHFKIEKKNNALKVFALICLQLYYAPTNTY